MMNCLVIAELRTIKIISEYIRVQPLILLGTASSGNKGLSLIEFCQPDIVFIDEKFALEYFLELYPFRLLTLFIIISAHTINLETLDELAFDYLTKPLDYGHFKIGIKRYIKFLCKSLSDKSDLFLKEDPSYITIDEGKSHFINIKHTDLLCIKAMENYVNIRTIHGNCYLVKMTMKSLESKLPTESFSRVHKSYIVNDYQIKTIAGGYIYMNKFVDMKVPIGEFYKRFFFNKEHIILVRVRKVYK